MNRRAFLATAGGGVSLFTACDARKQAIAVPAAPSPKIVVPALPPIRAQVDRMFRITVCLRPFRAQGPRMDVETVGEKRVVHNYGHGGSGWSLSWGSSSMAVEKALEGGGVREVGVIGCGALGLTSALLAQRAGVKVTIYAKERPPDVRSSRATGSWTPDSRVALADKAGANFPALWEAMARKSWKMYEGYLGAAGDPVEWLDSYMLSDRGPGRRPPNPERTAKPELEFARYNQRLDDILPQMEQFAPGTHPFPTQFAGRASNLTFNVASLTRTLIQEFLTEGGRIERADFQSPNELAALPQRVLINCTGYGARALWKDESIVPVRGQIAWLIPQPEARYGLIYDGVYVLSRRDGIVVQDGGIGEMEGYNNTDETPDRAAAEASVRKIATLFDRMATKRN
ncbi:D-amino-acid oxidase [Bryobacterales bacterium F-183]|nr:D-amino-acid oxidase [Bryobacterales bacterium F-183]